MFKIFVGYLFVFLHLRINGFDLLLNPVGYVLICLGLCAYPDIMNFKKAKPWAIIMMLVSSAEIFMGLSGLGVAVNIVLGMISVLISLVLMYLIDKGVAETEEKTGKQLNSDKLLSTWKFQAVLSIASSVLSVVLNEIWVNIIVSVAALVSHIVFLYYIYKAHKILKEEDPIEEETPEI